MNILELQVRKSSQKNIIFGLIVLIIFAAPLLIFPFREIIFPKTISAEAMDSSLAKGTDYVSMHFDTLYYSGYDLKSNRRITGRYYYSIEEDTLIWVLVPANVSSNRRTITSYDCNGRLRKKDKNFNTMLKSFSSDVDFSIHGMNTLSSNVILDAHEYRMTLYIFLYFYLLAVVILATCFVLFRVYLWFFPSKQLSYRRFKKLYGAANLEEVYYELTHPIAEFSKYIITEHFIYAPNSTGFVLLPLDKISQIYDHSKINRFLIWHKLTFSVYFVYGKHTHAVIHGISHEEMAELRLFIAEKYPHIQLGYHRLYLPKRG